MKNPRMKHIFISHCLPMIIVLLLFGIGASITSLITTNRITVKEKKNQLQQMVDHIDGLIGNVETINLMFSSTQDLLYDIEDILSTNALTYSQYKEMKILRLIISAAINPKPEIEDISIYIPNPQEKIFNSAGIELLRYSPHSSWFNDYLSTYHLFRTEMAYIPSDDGGPGLTRLSRPIINTIGDQIGVVALDVGHDVLSASHSKFFNTIYEGLEIENENGDVIYSRMGSNSRWQTKFTTSSAVYDWKYTLSINNWHLYRESFAFLIYTFWGLLITIMIGMLLTYRINKEERAFLSNIIDQLKKAGATSIEEPKEGKNVFSEMNDHIIKNFIENDFLKVQAEATEYRALQMQINPHFLFNTLDNINWKAIKLSNGENDVSEMILLLSRLLQYSLHVDNQTGVPLSTEIKECSNYIKLQMYRFKDKFTFTVIAKHGIPNINVPCMFIQPLLENSFNHGFINGKVLDIVVKIDEQDDIVSITISNNGLPLDKEKLDNLNERRPDVLQNSSSLGIHNTRKRLELFTKGKSTLIVSSDGINGVELVIKFPRS